MYIRVFVTESQKDLMQRAEDIFTALYPIDFPNWFKLEVAKSKKIERVNPYLTTF